MKQKLLPISLIILFVANASCSLLPGSGSGLPTVMPVAEVPSQENLPPTDTAVPSKTPLPTLLPNTTPTIIPGDSTPTPDPSCEYDIVFVADVNIADDTVIPPDVNFKKTWRVMNAGTCRWPAGSDWIFTHGDQMGNNTRVPISPVDPGEVIDITVLLLAPTDPGTYTSYWQLQLADGRILSPEFYVRIVVPIATATRPPRPTSAPTQSGGSGSDGTGGDTGGSTSTPAPTATATSSATAGWAGSYYANTTLTGTPVLQSTSSGINFNWGTGSPGSGVPSDNFSATWTRTFDFALGTYRFYATADDGVRVYVDGTAVIDEWHGATSNTYSADATISAGSHTVRVEYYEGSGDANLQVWWSETSTSSTWVGQYWSNRDLSGATTLVRNDTAVNFDWGTGSPDSSLPVDGFSARWTRALSFSAGTYTFKATMDDGMRIYIDSTLVLNEWTNGAERVRTFNRDLTAGTHTIVVEYYEVESDAVAKLSWEQDLDATDAWVAQFYANATLTGSPIVTKDVDTIDFNWGQNAPDDDVPADNFSIRFTRQIDFADDTYLFSASADDGIRVMVDGVIVIDQWNPSGDSQPYQADVDLDGVHTIVVEYYDAAVSAKVRFSYAPK
ncbi:MAG: hypothetical protein KC421_26390 [Anaerolineales bacterium]|nr:hypothetical protein [Anaerolineales bacterium]